MALETLRELFMHELKDALNAEQQGLKAMPRLAKNATTEELRQVLEQHRQETESQVQRLHQVFELLGEKPKGVRCAGMEGIIEECQEILKERAGKSVREAAIIACAQSMEHYEIAKYGTLATWAKELGQDQAAQIFVQILEEEKRADQLLTDVAKGVVNQLAARESEASQQMEGEEAGAGGGRSARGSRSTSSRSGASARRGAPSRAAAARGGRNSSSGGRTTGRASSGTKATARAGKASKSSNAGGSSRGSSSRSGGAAKSSGSRAGGSKGGTKGKK